LFFDFLLVSLLQAPTVQGRQNEEKLSFRPAAQRITLGSWFGFNLDLPPLISWGNSNSLVRALRPRNFVAHGYTAEVDHPSECFSAVGAHGIENQKFLYHGKTF
jgi:hypothetical protein